MVNEVLSMRIYSLLYCVIGCFFTALQAKAQGYTGKIKNDSAFVEVMVSSFTGLEAVSQQWGLPAGKLQQYNPDILSYSAGSSVVIMVPIYNLLKNEECDGCAAVYHFVGKSEGLFRIGKWYGNQPVAALKKRNNLRSDALSPGQKLLVGYILTPGNAASVIASNTPVIAKNDTAISLMEGTVANKIKEVPKPPSPRKILSYTGEGAFAVEFMPNSGAIVKKTGKASTFKSESGWSDGRFYILNSSLKTGLVVKITNSSTGVFLYAKVVGPLPDIKQNHGLSLRLSSAAATMLGFWEEEKSFDLSWEY
jgi:LysM repeat protein